MPSFSDFVTDLTQEARQGKCRPAYGCEHLYPEVFESLCGKSPNFVLVVGAKGNGKSRFLEGLTATGAKSPSDNPSSALRMLRLDFAALAAAVGRLDAPMRELAAFLSESSDIVLLIDDAAELLGIRPAPEHIQKAGAILAPALLQAQFRCIAAIDDDDYAKINAKNALPSGRSTIVGLSPFTRDRQIDALAAYAPALERRRNVAIDSSAIHAAATLPSRFTPATATPEDAMKMLDAACVRYSRKAATAHSAPELLEGTSLKALGDRVGAYDVVRTIEEAAKVDIRQAVIDRKNNLAAKMSSIVPGQRDAIYHAIDQIVNYEFGFTPAAGPAGLLVLWGTPEAPKQKVVDAATRVANATCAAHDSRKVASTDALIQTAQKAADPERMSFLYLWHIEAASPPALEALAAHVAALDPARTPAEFRRQFLVLGYDTPDSGGRMQVLNHLQKSFPAGFARRCDAVVKINP